ncbi:MAG: GNAT family N-acetyltransferase [Candidatus Micrarchaeia archaeon]
MAIPNLSFRFASEQDFDFIWTGRVEIADVEKFVIPDIEEDKLRVHSAIKDKKIRLALIENKPVGFIWFTISNATPFGVSYGPFDRKYAYVDYVFVHPDFRKLKIGTSLYQDLGEYCKKTGVNELICDVVETNANSKTFHKTLGFKPFVSLYSKKL